MIQFLYINFWVYTSKKKKKMKTGSWRDSCTSTAALARGGGNLNAHQWITDLLNVVVFLPGEPHRRQSLVGCLVVYGVTQSQMRLTRLSSSSSSIHTMEYFSVLKKNILLHATTWMNLQNSILSEMSQSQKHKYSMILFI